MPGKMGALETFGDVLHELHESQQALGLTAVVGPVLQEVS